MSRYYGGTYGTRNGVYGDVYRISKEDFVEMKKYRERARLHGDHSLALTAERAMNGDEEAMAECRAVNWTLR